MKVNSPQELRTLDLDCLRQLAEDIRQEILSACLTQGGHLGASLGAVELAIALHSCFDSPNEPIVWDVGHQAYAHKLITGRWDRFHTLRTMGGISGFLSRDESEHDVFGAGHSSTSFSAALGMAWARRAEPNRWSVAVIGDGGMTAGLALEALNNVRSLSLGPLAIVLNDNQMSISPNVGAIPAILAAGNASGFFDHFGLDYIGPVDGHDLAMLIGTFKGIREAKPQNKRPVLVHVLTQKGKGYIPAEEHPAAYHGVSPVQPAPIKKEPLSAAAATPVKKKSYSESFGESLCEVAQKDSRVVAITAAMPEGTGLTGFSRQFADRFFDVGIAEAHAVTFAAGLATQELRPVVAIYSTFLQRALDSIIHDVALQNLNVVFAVDRAGVVGADGPTHHGAFDLAYLGMIPGMTVFAPSCLSDVGELLSESLARPSGSGPVAIRYPRGSGPTQLDVPVHDHLRWHQTPESPRVIAIGLGATAERLLKAVKLADPAAKSVTAITCRVFKPIPLALLKYLQANTSAHVLIAEEGGALGGFGQSLAALLSVRQGKTHFAAYGDHFIPHGSVSEQEAQEGLSVEALHAILQKSLV